MSRPLLEGVTLFVDLISSIKATTTISHIYCLFRITINVAEANQSSLLSPFRARTAGCSFVEIPSTYSIDFHFSSQTKTVSLSHFGKTIPQQNHYYQHRVSSPLYACLFAGIARCLLPSLLLSRGTSVPSTTSCALFKISEI